MNILVTGSTGVLGSEICAYLTMRGEHVTTFDRKVFSWASPHENQEILNGIDCIIHCAANTDAENCEENPEDCYRDNTLLTERLAFSAGILGCKFVYISSTGVYGVGKLYDPYTEYDIVNPTTHHHRSKWLAENAVSSVVKNHLILRTGWIFGGETHKPKNFVARRIEEALKTRNERLVANMEQRGVPTFVRDFTSRLYELLLNNEVGTFNLVNSGEASRFDYISRICEFAQLDIDIEPVSASAFNRKAKVSNNEVAIPLKMMQIGYDPLPNWSESLEYYLKEELGDWLKSIR